MIDIHCHILPGVDDGPETIEQAVAMVRLAASDGITKIIATPHILDVGILPSRIKDLVEELNSYLVASAIPVEIIQGAEVNYLIRPDLLKEYTLSQSLYILIEFPHTHLPAHAGQTIFNLRINGYLPIIAHPERNPSVINNPACLLDILDDGVYLQLTAASVAGKFGTAVEKCAQTLLEKGAVHFLATDGHSLSWRRPQLSSGVKAAAKIIGSDEAEKLVTSNPEKVLAGLALDDE